MMIGETLLRFGVAVGLVASMEAGGLAQAQDERQQIVVLDECDPTTFNDALGLGTCLNVVSGGGVPFPNFLAALPEGHPAWLFAPAHTVTINKKDTLRVVNQGGEIHTFTEVAEFGGGFIPVLNNPPNAPTVPECAGGYANNARLASTRLIQGSTLVIGDLTKGLHHFECCVHPWMRLEVEVK